jgi:hypothetical protein
MKDSKNILKHMDFPYKNILVRHRCLNLLISLLPPVYHKYIKHSYLKENTLFIITTHQGINRELFFKLDMIKSILKIIQTQKNICLDIKIEQLRTFTDNTPIKRPTHSKIIKFYIKNVKDFENKAQNPTIKKKFEEIKEILKQRD